MKVDTYNRGYNSYCAVILLGIISFLHFSILSPKTTKFGKYNEVMTIVSLYFKFRHLIDELFEDVVTQFIWMGAGQFLRDFRTAFYVKRNGEHRKRILQRKTNCEQNSEKNPF